MTILLRNIIKCWRSIEELIPPVIETSTNPPTVINIVKEVLGDKDIPWLQLFPKPYNDEEYTY